MSDSKRVTKKRFIVTAETWYSSTSVGIWEPGVVAELSCGLDPIDEDGTDLGGTIGEWRVVWKDLTPGRRAAPQLRAFDDGWRALLDSGFHEVMADLADASATIGEFTAALTERGWIDCTERTRYRD